MFSRTKTSIKNKINNNYISINIKANKISNYFSIISPKSNLLIIVICILFCFETIGIINPIQIEAAKKKSKVVKKSISKKTKTLSKTSKSKSSKKKKTKKRKRRRYSVPFRKVSLGSYDIVQDTLLNDGVRYKNYIFGNSRYKHSIHVVEADLTHKDIGIKILKSKNLCDGLEMLPSLVQQSDSLNMDTVVAAINANYWRAYSNLPINPTVKDGEVVEMLTHKKWSSCFFDEDNMPYIGNFNMEAYIKKSDGGNLPIISVNHRKDSIGICVYNKFGGDRIPYIPDRKIGKILDDMVRDTIFEDSTEVELTIEKIKEDIKESKRIASIESGLKKIIVKYLNKPAINRKVLCLVTSIDTGTVKVPDDGCVITFGKDCIQDIIPLPGDNIELLFTTDKNENTVFLNSIGGTPRLLRYGIDKHEANIEGSKGRRFISSQLPRTAIGTNKSGDRLFIVVSEGMNGKVCGVNLTELATIMRKIGAFEAMNLDGGGSSAMVIDGKNILRPSNPLASRKISVGLAITKKKIRKRNTE